MENDLRKREFADKYRMLLHNQEVNDIMMIVNNNKIKLIVHKQHEHTFSKSTMILQQYTLRNLTNTVDID